MNYQKKINVGKDFHHDSASLQVSGEAIYIDDMIKNKEDINIKFEIKL